MGAVGEELATKLDTNCLANAKLIKHNIQSQAEKIQNASQKLKSLTPKK
jgi:hypothetical protein